MKIFYKKDFQRVLEEKNDLNKEYEDYKSTSENTISELNNKSYELLTENSKLKTLKLDVDKVKEELRKVNGAKGGLVKENNKLKSTIKDKDNEIADLKAKISDLQSDRYLIKKIPTGRTKSTSKTKITSSSKESNVIKYVKERL